jgi:hypothetical protein
MNNARVERMLRELHAGPPLRFLEDIFSLKEIVTNLIAELGEVHAKEEAGRKMTESVLVTLAR